MKGEERNTPFLRKRGEKATGPGRSTTAGGWERGDGGEGGKEEGREGEKGGEWEGREGEREGGKWGRRGVDKRREGEEEKEKERATCGPIRDTAFVLIGKLG